MLNDTRYALRILRRAPAFSGAVVATLALGIGACTVVFSIVTAVILRPMPYGAPDRLAYIWMPNDHLAQLPPNVVGPPSADFFDLQRDSRSFSSLAIFDTTSFIVGSTPPVQRLAGARVSAGFFGTLDVAAAKGRVIESGDEQRGDEPVAVISHRLWQSGFRGADDVLGKTVTLDRRSYRIVGVMPASFGYPRWEDLYAGEVGADATDVWVLLTMTREEAADRGLSDHVAIGRLRPGVALAEAQGETSGLVARLDLLRPPEERGWHAAVVSFVDSAIGSVRRPLWLLLGAVSLVLLVACSNAAHLLLARAASRAREMKVRSALGASRARLVGQVLAEAMLLAAGGGVLGIGLASAALRVLVRINPGNIPRLENTAIDGAVLLFSVVLSALTGVLFGVLPALWASRSGDALRSTASTAATAAGARVRQALVVAEVALAIVLLTGASLLARSYLAVARVDPGFSASTLTLRLWLDSRYVDTAGRLRLFREALDRVTRVQGVRAAGAVDALPLSHSERLSAFEIEGVRTEEPFVDSRSVTEGYFEAMGTRLAEGRLFDARDTEGRPPAIVVNRSFAAKFFPNRSAVGRRMRFREDDGPPRAWSTIVGMVADVRHATLEHAAAPQVYESLWQSDAERVYFAVRTDTPSPALLSSIRSAVQAADPMLPVSQTTSMDALIGEATSRRRFQMIVLVGFGALSLLLAGIGLYGLLAALVKERSRELGIRVALGATREDVIRLVVGHGMSLTGLGILSGIGGSWLLTRLLQGMLYSVTPTDPESFVTVVCVLTAAAAVACYLPAARAARVDPAVVLRAE